MAETPARSRSLEERLTTWIRLFGGVMLAVCAMAVLFIMLARLGVLGFGGLGEPDLPTGKDPAVLGNVDRHWKLETLEGQERTFGSFAGRVVFVNVWATWCPPCVAEVPSIQDLHDAVKDQGVEFVMVTIEPPDDVLRFVAAKGWHVPVYVARGNMPDVFQCTAIPTTFVVNRRGEVVFRHTGAADWNTAAFRDFLRGL
jgi:thiol-disulfide isomerase/thioredoxin